MAEGVLLGAAAGGVIYLLAKNAVGELIQIPISLSDILTKDLRNQGFLPPWGAAAQQIDLYHVEDSFVVRGPAANAWIVNTISIIGGAPVWHGRNLQSSTVGDYLEINYTGADVWVRVRMGPTSGVFNGFVDNLNVAFKYDCSTATADSLQIVPFGLNLERGSHKFRLTVVSGTVEVNGFMVKHFRGAHQIFAYPESALSTLSAVASLKNGLLESDTQNSASTAIAGTVGGTQALVANTALLTATIQNGIVENVEVVVVIATDSTAVLTTWTLKRGTTTLQTFTTPAGAAQTKSVFLDQNAPQGSVSYTITPNSSTGFAGAEIFLLNADAVEAHAVTSGSNNKTWNLSGLIALSAITASITLNNIGTVQVEIALMTTNSGVTYNLNKDGALLTTFTPGTGLSILQFTDSNVSAAAHSYSLDSGGVATRVFAFLCVISNGGATGLGTATITQVDLEQYLGGPVSAVNPIDVKLDTSTFPAQAVLADATANPTVSQIAIFGLLWNGASWDRCRTPNVFKSVIANTVGNTAVWTPAAGKKFRLMGFIITVAGDLLAAGEEVLQFQDATTVIARFGAVLGTTLVSGETVVIVSPPMGNGFLSAAANNVLNINLGTSLAAGHVSVDAWGTEE